MAGGDASSQHYSDGRERCCGAGRQHTAACNVLVALLQQRARCRNVAAMASNALDLAALLRWSVARWTSRCVAAMSGSALGLGALLRCPTALQLWPTLRCSVFVFFTRQLEERKRMEKERSFDTYFLVSRLRLSLLWLVVRNAKLPPTTPVATIVMRSFRQQQHE
jgi:hypothetical protein